MAESQQRTGGELCFPPSVTWNPAGMGLLCILLAPALRLCPGRFLWRGEKAQQFLVHFVCVLFCCF